ncbi:MAG: radical SAM protein [Rhodospirillales bacterium]
MAEQLKIFLADLAHDYLQANFTVPYGVGLIASYLNEKFSDRVDVTLFKSTGELIDRIRDNPPDVVGLSNYSWNEGLNRLVEKRLAELAPDAVVLQGGPHIRTDNAGIREYLLDHPQVHYYAMFEGEWPTAFLIERFFEQGGTIMPNDMAESIPGLAFLRNGELVYQPYSSGKHDLDLIPSPYLNGLLDEYIEAATYQPLIETNRGCPFACTFCAWGIAALNKVRRFGTERIIREIEYISERSPSVYWQFADANFGMFERDIDIAHALKKAADTTRLQKVLVNWAKNSSRFCVEIQHILKGISDPLVAVQSTDPEVLAAIKRGNIKMSTMTDLLEQGEKDGIPFSTDVLTCLPGETYESHLETLRTVFKMGFAYFNIGQIRMLPGSEMENDETREKFALKTQYRLISGGYGIYDGEPVVEYEESVVSSSTMTREDVYQIRIIHFFAWAIWNSGLGQPLLRWMHVNENVNPLDALLGLIESKANPALNELRDSYVREIRSEWFDSKEDLIEHFTKNIDGLLDTDYVKINLKFLARILLDRNLARQVLLVLAEQSNNPVAVELVDFCLDRIFFLDTRTTEKSVTYSPAVVEALSMIYPSVEPDSPATCQFSVTQAFFDMIEFEMERYDFTTNQIRNMALFLQQNGTFMMYDFRFGDALERGMLEQAVDSFDYQSQIQT